MSDWGVLYVVWGDTYKKYLDRSIASLKRHHPDIGIHVEVLEKFDDPKRQLLAKANMHKMSPFRNTLFLDIDTVVMGPLDYAFRKAEKFGLALSICECPWARRYVGLEGDITEYNTGVLFFTPQAAPFFDTWAARAHDAPSLLRWLDQDGQMRGQDGCDQGSFSVAMEESGMNPYVLPFNWNFRPIWHRSFFAPIKIWHDYRDPPDLLVQVTDRIENNLQPPSYMEFNRGA